MKDFLRETYLQKRDNLPTPIIRKKSAQIIHKLYHLPEIIEAKTIFSYISFRSEVYTHELIQSFIKSKKVIVPIVTDTKKKTLLLSHLRNWDHISIGVYGIPEPKEIFIKKVLPTDIDVVLVPGILFDTWGHRIGYGGGYFDRFLRKLTTIKIGLAFDIQIIEKIPNSEHDVAMDKIVTDKRVIRGKK